DACCSSARGRPAAQPVLDRLSCLRQPACLRPEVRHDHPRM
ncbi:MAG: hypothetical protein AVDCRST_MAG23-2666, partial [uncultured Sphingosinicella sp.]